MRKYPWSSKSNKGIYKKRIRADQSQSKNPNSEDDGGQGPHRKEDGGQGPHRKEDFKLVTTATTMRSH